MGQSCGLRSGTGESLRDAAFRPERPGISAPCAAREYRRTCLLVYLRLNRMTRRSPRVCSTMTSTIKIATVTTITSGIKR